MADTSRKTLTACGKSLEYQWFGPSPDEALTILLLHEGLGSVAMWRDFPQQLVAATGLGVCAYSRAGYGWSDPADLPRRPDYMTREAVEVLPCVLDAIGARRVILMGHSDGASIAAIHAGSVSDRRVRATILMAPHFFTEEVGLAAIRQAGAQFAASDMATRMKKYHRDPEASFRGWHDAWVSPDFAGWNVADVIDHWRIPALVIQGRQDEYGTLAQIAEIESRAYCPVETLILDDCRHNPHLDQPQAVLAAIRDFVARLERIEAAQAVGL